MPGAQAIWYSGWPAGRSVRAVLLALAAALGCQDPHPPHSTTSTPAPAAAVAPAPPAPLRAAPDKLDLGAGPIRNPLNLYDVDIQGSPDADTAGTVDGVRITMQDLEAQSVGAFSRIAERIYQAQDNGYAWLLERVALDKLAAAAKQPLIPYLLQQYASLPQPTDADIEQVLATMPLAALSAEERRLAAISTWRLHAWESRRRDLVMQGHATTQFERVRQQISNPAYARPETVVARLDGQPITRAEERVLAGYQAELARHEYWHIARLQFDKYVTSFLREREAKLLGITTDALIELEVSRTPAATDADVRAYMQANPEYQRDPEGYERARDNLRRLRSIDAETRLDERLRSTADIRFYLPEPAIQRFSIEVPAPRWHGPPEARNVLVAFHALGCDNCTRGSKLLLSVIDAWAARPGGLKLLAGDYFEPGQIGSYRGALALHCAPPQARDALLRALVADFGTGELGSLIGKAQAAGADPERFRACLERDTFVPVIVENLAMARRLGLERNVPGLFANGVRIGELKDLDKVLQQLEQALLPVQP